MKACCSENLVHPGSLSTRNKIEAGLLVSLLFIISISSSLKSVFLPLTLLFIVFNSSYRPYLVSVFKEKWARAAVILFALIVLSCAWSPALLSKKMLYLDKYSKLLFLPLLALGYQDRTRRKLALDAFLFAMFLTCLLSILRKIGFTKDFNPDIIFFNYIVTSYLMAFAAYLSALFGLRQRKKQSAFFYLFLFCMFSYQLLFINVGRTGYVIYFLLLSLLFLQSFSWKKVLLSFLSLGFIFAVSYYESPIFSKRIQEGFHDISAYQQASNQKTSLGYRLLFSGYAKKLFLAHPIQGQGANAYAYYFNKENPFPSWTQSSTYLNPHNQYWLMAADTGILGLLALFYFFSTLLAASFQLKENKAILQACILALIVGNFFDTFLFSSTIGYFFIAMSALCLGEKLGQPQQEKREKQSSLSDAALNIQSG